MVAAAASHQQISVAMLSNWQSGFTANSHVSRRSGGHLRANRKDGDYPLLPSMAAMSAADVETAPNTPPCFLIIEIAASWFRGSVAAQQSCVDPRGAMVWGAINERIRRGGGTRRCDANTWCQHANMSRLNHVEVGLLGVVAESRVWGTGGTRSWRLIVQEQR